MSQDPATSFSRLGTPLWSASTRTADQTLALGRHIGARLMRGQVAGLVGTLGAGKTHLVKGIASGNGLADPGTVTSPTFILVNEYEGRLHLYHLDVYRLGGGAELAALGFDEMLEGEQAVVVEWADRVPDAMPVDTLWIRISITGPDSRRFDFFGSSAVAPLVEAIRGSVESA